MRTLTPHWFGRCVFSRTLIIRGQVKNGWVSNTPSGIGTTNQTRCWKRRVQKVSEWPCSARSKSNSFDKLKNKQPKRKLTDSQDSRSSPILQTSFCALVNRLPLTCFPTDWPQFWPFPCMLLLRPIWSVSFASTFTFGGGRYFASIDRQKPLTAYYCAEWVLTSFMCFHIVWNWMEIDKTNVEFEVRFRSFESSSYWRVLQLLPSFVLAHFANKFGTVCWHIIYRCRAVFANVGRDSKVKWAQSKQKLADERNGTRWNSQRLLQNKLIIIINLQWRAKLEPLRFAFPTLEYLMI